MKQFLYISIDRFTKYMEKKEFGVQAPMWYQSSCDVQSIQKIVNSCLRRPLLTSSAE